jgi:hypothetical protein
MHGQALLWTVSMLRKSWGYCELCDKHINGVAEAYIYIYIAIGAKCILVLKVHTVKNL